MKLSACHVKHVEIVIRTNFTISTNVLHSYAINSREKKCARVAEAVPRLKEARVVYRYFSLSERTKA
jgi:hypothetical protein